MDLIVKCSEVKGRVSCFSSSPTLCKPTSPSYRHPFFRPGTPVKLGEVSSFSRSRTSTQPRTFPDLLSSLCREFLAAGCASLGFFCSL
ncbi:hypothetical protein SLEP1_g4887 [Rubroshorea leprosula]|uniref:Uncharacterized protein n=1 Tax=Rubroshorea leprosula TaxID=152421 RepID=A0AAV5HY99_9ROSI|nr:hypothetical protein SLEP1_g4887 [Rubroshorea leprosula]